MPDLDRRVQDLERHLAKGPLPLAIALDVSRRIPGRKFPLVLIDTRSHRILQVLDQGRSIGHIPDADVPSAPKGLRQTEEMNDDEEPRAADEGGIHREGGERPSARDARAASADEQGLG